jgi:hypothetical protein
VTGGEVWDEAAAGSRLVVPDTLGFPELGAESVASAQALLIGGAFVSRVGSAAAPTTGLRLGAIAVFGVPSDSGVT